MEAGQADLEGGARRRRVKRRGQRQRQDSPDDSVGSPGQCVGPLLFAVMRLQRHGDPRGRQPADVDAELFASFNRIREELEQVHGIDGEDLRDVSYALSGFVDERLTRAPDPLGLYWRNAFWERRLFDTADAGVDFFKLLDKHQGTRNVPVLDVLFRCLMLGFAGKYRGGREHELDAIADRLMDVLDEALDLSAAPLSPRGTAPREPQFDRRRNGWLTAAVLGFTGLALLVYAGSTISLQATASDLVECVPIGNGDLCRYEEEID